MLNTLRSTASFVIKENNKQTEIKTRKKYFKSTKYKKYKMQTIKKEK